MIPSTLKGSLPSRRMVRLTGRFYFCEGGADGFRRGLWLQTNDASYDLDRTWAFLGWAATEADARASAAYHQQLMAVR